jgi:sporulation protein YlmC with PRC-barrel domain
MTPVLSASTLSGDKVHNAQGENLGKIEDFLLDMDTGRIAYAVLSFDGALNGSDKLFAVPPEALRLDADNKCFVINVDKKTLENAPGFDKDHWPNFADRSFGTQIYSYYGRRPYWTS